MNKLFGISIDIIDSIMKGIVLYNLALVYNYWGYQDGNGSFQPFLCMLIFPAAFEVVLINNFVKANLRKAALIFVVVLNWMLSRCVPTSTVAFFVISCIPLIENEITRYRLRQKKDVVEIIRNRNHSRCRFYGIALCVIPIWGIVDSDLPTTEYPLTFDSCMSYLTVFFVLFTVLVILSKYMNMQYRHLSKHKTIQKEYVRRQLRVDFLMGIFVLLVFVPVIFLAKNTLIQGLCLLIGNLFVLLFNYGVLALSDSLVSKILEMFSVTGSYDRVPTGAAENSGAFLMTAGADNTVFYLVIGGIIIGVAVAVVSLLTIYKVKGAVYKSENEEAEFVEEHKIKDIEIKEVITTKAVFPNHANGKIRKYYYKYMNRKVRKSDLQKALCNTPEELAENFAQRDDERFVQEITECYEKARYSGEAASGDDVKRVRKLYKELI